MSRLWCGGLSLLFLICAYDLGEDNARFFPYLIMSNVWAAAFFCIRAIARHSHVEREG